jgi:hypothetical protein
MLAAQACDRPEPVEAALPPFLEKILSHGACGDHSHGGRRGQKRRPSRHPDQRRSKAHNVNYAN